MPLLTLLLVAAQPAGSQPNFPLQFEGEICTAADTCQPFVHEVHADGGLVELMSGITGQYHYNPNNQRYRAAYSDFAGTTFDGFKVNGAPCVDGTWYTQAGVGSGTFSMCKIP